LNSDTDFDSEDDTNSDSSDDEQSRSKKQKGKRVSRKINANIQTKPEMSDQISEIVMTILRKQNLVNDRKPEQCHQPDSLNSIYNEPIDVNIVGRSRATNYSM
jgi:hypothetical protein